MKGLGRTAALGLAGLALVLAGCGEDDKADAPGSEALPKREFIAAADRICTQVGKKYDAVVAELPPLEKIAAPDVSRRLMLEAGSAGPRIAAIEREGERKLRALAPPADVASRWEKLLVTLETRAAQAEQIETAAEAGDREAYLTALQRFDEAGTVSSDAVRGYGFKVCAAG